MPCRFAESLRAGSGSVPSWSCSQVVSKPVWHIPLLCVQHKTPDDGQRNCPKHVEFYSQKQIEKLVHLFGFIIRICDDARSLVRQIHLECSLMKYIYMLRKTIIFNRQAELCVLWEKTTNGFYFFSPLVFEAKILRFYLIILKRKYVARYLPLFKLSLIWNTVLSLHRFVCSFTKNLDRGDRRTVPDLADVSPTYNLKIQLFVTSDLLMFH